MGDRERVMRALASYWRSIARRSPGRSPPRFIIRSGLSRTSGLPVRWMINLVCEGGKVGVVQQSDTQGHAGLLGHRPRYGLRRKRRRPLSHFATRPESGRGRRRACPLQGRAQQSRARPQRVEEGRGGEDRARRGRHLRRAGAPRPGPRLTRPGRRRGSSKEDQRRGRPGRGSQQARPRVPSDPRRLPPRTRRGCPRRGPPRVCRADRERSIRGGRHPRGLDSGRGRALPLGHRPVRAQPSEGVRDRAREQVLTYVHPRPVDANARADRDARSSARDQDRGQSDRRHGGGRGHRQSGRVGPASVRSRGGRPSRLQDGAPEDHRSPPSP